MADGPTSPAQDPGALFRAALDLHRAGRLEEAVAGYRTVVSVAPDHVFSHVNLGVVLRRLRRFDEALASYDRALAFNPDSADALNNRANLLRDLGRPAEALESYNRAIALKDDIQDGHANRGHVLRDLKRPTEALESYERALARAPDNVQILRDRGAALFDLERWEQAVESYDRAIAIQPDFIDAHRGRTLALRRLNRLEDAEAGLASALVLKPNDAGLHSLLGQVLGDLGRHEAALASHGRALALEPDLAVAHNGRGSMLFALERPQEALASYDRAIALSPDFVVAHRNRGIALRRLRRLDEAVRSHGRAIALQPESPEAYWYRSLCHLTAGRFSEGWPDYERRWEVEGFAKSSGGVASPFRAAFSPPPAARDLAGRHVLAVGEQGVGDVVMFASMLPDLMADAASVSLVCDRRLWRLFGHSFPGLTLLEPEAATSRLADFEVVMGIGSLGRLYRNAVGDFPGRPYLSASPEVIATWAERLGPAQGRRRIGLSWRGGVADTRRSARSMDLGELGPVLGLPDCEFVSLQYGSHEAEVAEVSAGLARPIRLFPKAEIDDFEDLAGLVQNLDLVVSVQTSLVHLSGAVGARTLVMVPATPEWRYTAASPTMPWYGSVALFRQDEDEAWAPVVRRVAEAAQREIAS
jgi:tetratricopeptide (TPR) repeat protein